VTKVLLVRHGETEWNAIRRVQGHLDSALSERGRQQAEAVAAHLKSVPLQAIYSSDLSRARDTAAPIAAAHGLTAVTSCDLREKSYGEWEGLTEAEIAAADPSGWRRYHVERQLDYAIPGGETWLQVQDRIVSALQRILADHPNADDTVLLVGHGGSLRLAILHALHARLPILLRLRLDNGSLSLLEYDAARRGRVTYMNDTNHLKALSL
jgi:alpha-ribazole phosphatase/probable phosphoglycerate mutase